MFSTVLKNRDEILSKQIRWLPSNPQWGNFVTTWNWVNPPLWRAFLNSVFVVVSSVLLQLFACSLVGYVLAKHKFKGNRTLFLWILTFTIIQGTPSIFPFLCGIVNLIPSYMLMHWLGWYNTYLSLIIPAVFSAYTIFLMRQYIITIPDSMLDTARLAGCSEFGLYWRIILPLSKPALTAIGFINFIWRWNDWLWPIMMIKDADLYTVQLTVVLLWDIKDTAQFLNIVAAAIAIAMIPLIIFTIVFQKYLLKGFENLSIRYSKK